MKVLFLSSICLCSCAANEVSTTTTTAADAKTGVELWAERKAEAEAQTLKLAPGRPFDPFAVPREMEEAAVPRLEVTPTQHLRAKSEDELDAALPAVKASRSHGQALRRLQARLGSPSWTETFKTSKGSLGQRRRIWIVPASSSCRRLVLEADGSVSVERASRSDWRILTGSVRQNACSGEVRREHR